MARGGARSRSGPTPDPNALRRSRASDPAWTKIPAAGRGKPAPEWPLPTASERELALWAEWWAHPVAVLWDEAQAAYDVACGVRLCVETEQPKARVEDRKTAKQTRSDLYLTADAQLRARILIVDDNAAASAPAEDLSNVTDIKDRLSRGSA